MDKRTQFFDSIQREPVMTLATAEGGRVTMRLVSPARHGDQVLIFTAAGSKKYAQLRANPRCCLAVGPFFAEAAATFCGPTMNAENRPLREAYAAKFPDAFQEGVAFGGQNAEFLLLRPTRLSGWGFENDVPNPAGIPTVPFDMEL